MRSRNEHVYNTATYVRARAALLSSGPRCHEPGAIGWRSLLIHGPPLSRHQHLKGAGCCVLRAHCRFHGSQQGARLRNESRPPNRALRRVADG
jgi:hypothetical protein